MLALGTLLVAPSARAQDASPAREPAAGPTLAASRVGFQPALDVSTTADASMQARRGGLSSGQKLMILGGATFLVGALVGDDAGTVIMVGGAAIGLYGLYLWLNEGAVGVGGRVAVP
jgi:hypothetical protein